MRKILFVFLISLLLLLASCSSKDEVDENEYMIRVYDIDDELLLEDRIDKNVSLDDTIDNYNPIYDDSNNVLLSLAGSIIDPSYSLVLYHDDYMVNLDTVEIVGGSSYIFRVENNKAFDEIDILVDKAYYSFMKKYYQDMLKATSESILSDFYLYNISYLMSSYGYDERIFNIDNSDDYENELMKIDLSSLSGAKLGIYYYVARALNYDLTDYLKFYEEYVTNKEIKFNEFVTPFMIAPLKELSMKPNWLDAYLDAPLVNTTYGPDALVWQLSSNSLFKEISEDDLSQIIGKIDFPKSPGPVSKALVLGLYSTLGYDINQKELTSNECTILESLMKHYDDDMRLIKCSNDATSFEYGTSQIYMNISIYKLYRDLGKQVSLFA